MTPILFVEAVNSYSNFAFVIPFSNPASRRWMHFHGVSPDICCDVWKRLDVVNTMAAEGINGSQPKHLMWALYFLKVYGKEEDNANYAGGIDQQTFRKWTHIFVEAISFLESSVVSANIIVPHRFFGVVSFLPRTLPHLSLLLTFV